VTQSAVVRQRLPGGRVTVAVRRPASCGQNCAACGGPCAPDTTLLVTARDPLGAREGDTVTVESSSRRVLGLAGLTYLCPVLLFFAGCAVFPMWALPEAAGGGAGFVIGFLPAVLAGRRLKSRGGIKVTVVAIKQ